MGVYGIICSGHKYKSDPCLFIVFCVVFSMVYRSAVINRRTQHMVICVCVHICYASLRVICVNFTLVGWVRVDVAPAYAAPIAKQKPHRQTKTKKSLKFKEEFFSRNFRVPTCDALVRKFLSIGEKGGGRVIEAAAHPESGREEVRRREVPSGVEPDRERGSLEGGIPI